MTERTGRSPLTGRLLLYGTLAAFGLILLMSLLVDRSIRNIWLDDLDSDLAVVAATASVGLPPQMELNYQVEIYQQWAVEMSEAAGVRFTLIDTDGVVLADSSVDFATMENHSDREEVREALASEIGVATRVSATTGLSERYLALPPSQGMIVRVSTETRVIDSELDRTRSAIVRVSLVVAAVALLGLFIFGRRLAAPVEALANQAERIAGGDLAVNPVRSQVAELDTLGQALESISRNLGGRVAEAEQASSLLEMVLANIPQGTVLFDGSDVVAYWNTSAERILGVVPVDLSHLTPFQLQVAVREARATGEPVVSEIDHGVPPKRLRGMATPFEADPRVLLVVVDVTERERIDSIRRDFVANASHELKTPVATIIAASEALQIALSREDVMAEVFASQIEGSALQLQRLVADLLDLSRLEREVPELVPVRIDQVVADEAGRARSRAKDNRLNLTVETEEVTVLANRRDLGIVARNLLDNAIRYTPEGGTVAVSVETEDGWAVLRVSDSGEGIPTKDLDRVFERFYRVDSARSRETGGTGLGLSIVRHVAETHGGTVAVTSELGRGSTFTVRLPLPDSERPQDN